MPVITSKRPTATYIDLDALAANFHAAKRFIGNDVSYMAVVKADAYGHGAVECARRLETEGVDWFGVAIAEEGVVLREAGIRSPILCLGSIWPGQEASAVEYSLTPVIFDIATAESLNAYARSLGVTVSVHVKIDTGMHRAGVSFDGVPEFINGFSSFGDLRITGLLTHFSSAEDTSQDYFTRLQIERFDAACRLFSDAGHTPEWIDLANSPAAIAHPESRGNMVRLGGALYGLLDDILPQRPGFPELRPVLSLRSRIAHLRRLSAGETLGYGRTFTTTRDSVIALVPIGYADGYPRGLSNIGKVVINGVIAPIVGRISMDWTLVDVSDLPVAVGDEVVLIGGDEASVSAADIAKAIGTIGYEITCGISPRVPRIYSGGHK